MTTIEKEWKVVKKVSWFVDNVLQKNFNSYEHAADHFRTYFLDERISNITVRRIVMKNECFKDNIYYPLKIPKHKDLFLDVRFYVYDLNEDTQHRVCSFCKVPKPFTNDFFYLKGRHNAKCRLCRYNKIGNKHTDDFNSHLDDTWKSVEEFKHLYFERDTESIFNSETGKYFNNIRSFRNITGKDPIEMKWVAFYGEIPKNKLVRIKEGFDTIQLDNLECVFMECDVCQKIVQNPTSRSIYCSKKCQTDLKQQKERESRNSQLESYLLSKYRTQKSTNKSYNIDINYNTDYLLSIGINCCYCNIECTFGNTEPTPETLGFDRKDSNIGYIKENIVVCCWFCNRIKNITKYDDWVQYMEFIQDPNVTVLDLSNKYYSPNSRSIDISTVYGSLKRSSPDYYPDSTSAKKVFLELVKTQNFKDSLFNFFPIIYLDRNCLWNASIDAINPSLPDSEKHRPDNLQIIPKCFNYGKNDLTQEDFLKEWTKRGFKTDFTGCTILLPENYNEQCYFHKMIIQ
jgi:hypothetical protein